MENLNLNNEQEVVSAQEINDASKKNSYAGLISMLCGIASFLFGCGCFCCGLGCTMYIALIFAVIPGIVAIIFAIKAKKDDGKFTFMSVIGLIMGILPIIALLIIVLFFVAFVILYLVASILSAK